MSPQGGGLIEIGILRVEGGKIVERYQTLIRPARRVSRTISNITGISNDELDLAPCFEDIAHEVARLLKGAVLVAHNARFDYSFIKAEFARLELPYRAKTLCTVKLSRALYPKQAHHNLDAVIEAHGIVCKQRHRAMDDAQALWEFLRSVEKAQGSNTLSAAIDRALAAHTLPARLSREDLRGIPERPGVYIFYGEDGEVLYVGKSVTLRTRVLSHFSNDHQSTKELRLCEQVARVEYRQTSGELSALFLESRLVKELRPTYNRALRETKQLAVVTRSQDQDGYAVADVEYRSTLEPSEFGNILAVCRSRAQAKAFLRTIAKESSLCAKMLGLEKGTACFAHQLGWCRGACIGAERPAMYNRRLSRAFAKYRIKSWPFGGPIVVRDGEGDEGVAYVVDHWCLRAIIRFDHGSHATEATDAVFDLDSYKILARFLLDDKKSRGLVSVMTAADWHKERYADYELEPTVE
jgi:DNA polymerase-3 subunit epsilon